MVIFTLHGVGTPHRLCTPGEIDTWLTIKSFESILDELLRWEDFSVTIDDSNSSDTDIVLPALVNRKIKGTFFISAGKLGQLGYLSRNGVQELSQAGMIVGSHGMYHHSWRRCSDEELSEELYISKNILEQVLGCAVLQAACPYGEYDRRVLRNLRRVGFQTVYTSDTGAAMPSAWLQARNTLHSVDTPESVRRIINQSFFGWVELKRTVKKAIKRWR
jgi:peptidoglycan/xylan/chitin deacetylase (PgdA/CDA1 family)